MNNDKHVERAFLTSCGQFLAKQLNRRIQSDSTAKERFLTTPLLLKEHLGSIDLSILPGLVYGNPSLTPYHITYLWGVCSTMIRRHGRRSDIAHNIRALYPNLSLDMGALTNVENFANLVLLLKAFSWTPGFSITINKDELLVKGGQHKVIGFTGQGMVVAGSYFRLKKRYDPDYTDCKPIRRKIITALPRTSSVYKVLEKYLPDFDWQARLVFATAVQLGVYAELTLTDQFDVSRVSDDTNPIYSHRESKNEED